ncbi:MAG: zinc ribbon domain-containing protein [Thermoplasmata archaeon]
MVKYCPRCGTPNEDDALYCVKCGNPFSSPQNEKLIPSSPTQSSYRIDFCNLDQFQIEKLKEIILTNKYWNIAKKNGKRIEYP